MSTHDKEYDPRDFGPEPPHIANPPKRTEQKPMAWKYFTRPLERRLEHLQTKEHQNSFDKHEISALKHVLWIVKQPKRTWVGLTEERIKEIWLNGKDHGDDWTDVLALARSFEAELKEKNSA